MENRKIMNKAYLHYLESLPKEVYMQILQNCYVEITATDPEGNVIYANPASVQYHNMLPEEMTKFNFATSFNGLWTPPSIDYAKQVKRTVFVRQRYLLTNEVHVTITTPIYNQHKQLEMILFTSFKEKPITAFDLDCMQKESDAPKSLHEKNKVHNHIIGRSYVIYATLEKLKRGARSDIPVLLLGESGVGKTLFAKYVHDCSPRSAKPFISVNCASIPDNLIESELFGYVPYAFTGASPKGKKGLFELADGGTLFLDEIGELQMNIQVKLLEFLESHQFICVGGLEPTTVDTRIITATNKDLEERVKEGSFREDLYWRINGIAQTIPPLRERRNDIFPIANFFLDKYNAKYKKDKVFSNEVVEAFNYYDWPGNVRELRNAVEYMAVLSIGNIIDDNKLPEQILRFINNGEHLKHQTIFEDMVEGYKKDTVEKYYTLYPEVPEFSEALGVSQATAYRLIKKYIRPGEA
ncbi:MAG: sigma 54-interacting transcriptional regulator [Eubacterium aggregans]|uniref:sigma-54 interaction domain-containing protein n=1 Tax=Eubacterium aggregans TaxID=81409 RepID=UPI0023F35363|nr:sigma 54-interacting transcriptional regulator [Eubacterium aggregans]MDD4692569.1 sigma 54-interacting transcriptional regulator [Eubacterium aggregans]MEA5072919.1 sigma 54-interacting transcriptional regulator [Eubacterium aggregans]